MIKTIAVHAVATALLLAIAIEPAAAARSHTGAGIAFTIPKVAHLSDLAMVGSILSTEASDLPHAR